MRLIGTAVLLAIFLAVAVVAAHAVLNGRPEDPRLAMPLSQQFEQCRAQPTLPWCVATVDEAAREGFTYVADPGNSDTWRSHADQVLAGQPWSGDCDDLASTAADLLIRMGVPRDRVWLVLVDTRGKTGTFDHMVAATVDDAGQYWVVGDTARSAYPLQWLPYSVFGQMRVSDGIWLPPPPAAHGLKASIVVTLASGHGR